MPDNPLIPSPDVIRRRLEAVDRERRDLRQLLKLAERHHEGRSEPTGPITLETKQGG